MRLLRIDTNKNRSVDGGFRHTVFESSKINGKSMINIIDSVKFNDVLDAASIESYKSNPKEFIESLNTQETD